MSGFVLKRKEGAPKAEMAANVFDPIKPGRYDAHIYNAEFKEFGGTGANAGRPAYNLSFKVAPGQDHAGRVLFLSPMLLLDERWAPTPKNPQGYPNNTLWEFLAAIDDDGHTAKEILDEYNTSGELTIPSPEDFVGKLVNINVGLENDNYAWAKDGSPEGKQDEYKRNTIRRISRAEDADEENAVVAAAPVDKGGKRKLTL